MAELLSANAYGRRRGVSHVAVLKAIAAGRLARSVTRPGPKKILIDPVLADQEWEQNTNPAQQREKEALEVLPGTAGEQGELFKTPAEERATAAQKATIGARLATARAAKETWQARTAQLTFEQLSGKLIDRKQGEAEGFKIGRQMRDAFLLVPSRLAPSLVSQTDLIRIEDVLRAEIIKTLEDFVTDAAAAE